MRAAVFKQPGRPFAIEEVPDPQPGPGQILIKVQRCGICGSDVHLTSGKGLFNHQPDTVLGHEYAGEVIELGSGVSGFSPGDLVTALPAMGCGTCHACRAGDVMRCASKISCSHGFAEYVLAGAESTLKLPPMVSVSDAALTEPLCCGIRGITRAGMERGARVLVIGAGPIGLAAAYWARRLGASKVATTARSGRATAIALEMGADSFLLADDNLAQASRDALGGEPDIVVEASGAEGMIARAIDLVRPDGVVSVLGYCTVPDTILPYRAINKEARVAFSFYYTRSDFERSLDVMNSGDLAAHAMITDTVSLDEFPSALQALRAPNDQCKVLLDPWKAS